MNVISTYIADYQVAASYKSSHLECAAMAAVVGVIIGVLTYYLFASGAMGVHLGLSGNITAAVAAGGSITSIALASLQSHYATHFEKIFEKIPSPKSFLQLVIRNLTCWKNLGGGRIEEIIRKEFTLEDVTASVEALLNSSVSSTIKREVFKILLRAQPDYCLQAFFAFKGTDSLLMNQGITECFTAIHAELKCKPLEQTLKELATTEELSLSVKSRLFQLLTNYANFSETFNACSKEIQHSLSVINDFQQTPTPSTTLTPEVYAKKFKEASQLKSNHLKYAALTVIVSIIIGGLTYYLLSSGIIPNHLGLVQNILISSSIGTTLSGISVNSVQLHYNRSLQKKYQNHSTNSFLKMLIRADLDEWKKSENQSAREIETQVHAHFSKEQVKTLVANLVRRFSLPEEKKNEILTLITTFLPITKEEIEAIKQVEKQ